MAVPIALRSNCFRENVGCSFQVANVPRSEHHSVWVDNDDIVEAGKVVVTIDIGIVEAGLELKNIGRNTADQNIQLSEDNLAPVSSYCDQKTGDNDTLVCNVASDVTFRRALLMSLLNLQNTLELKAVLRKMIGIEPHLNVHEMAQLMMMPLLKLPSTLELKAQGHEIVQPPMPLMRNLPKNRESTAALTLMMDFESLLMS